MELSRYNGSYVKNRPSISCHVVLLDWRSTTRSSNGKDSFTEDNSSSVVSSKRWMQNWSPLVTFGIVNGGQPLGKGPERSDDKDLSVGQDSTSRTVGFKGWRWLHQSPRSRRNVVLLDHLLWISGSKEVKWVLPRYYTVVIIVPYIWLRPAWPDISDWIKNLLLDVG